MNRCTLAVALAAMVTVGCREAALDPDVQAPAARVTGNTAASSTILTQSFDMPLSAFTRFTLGSCQASSGPGIRAESRIELDGLSTQVAFEGGTGGTPDEAEATFEVVSTGADVQLPPRSGRASVGDDPYVWIQFEDNQGNDLAPPVSLGRCSQVIAPRDLALDYESLVRASAAISVNQCGTQLGPMVAVAGELALQDGLVAKVIVRNDLPPGSPEVGADAIVRLQLYEPGYTIGFRRQQVRADVEGDAVITASFRDSQGTLVGEWVTLGTCEGR